VGEARSVRPGPEAGKRFLRSMFVERDASDGAERFRSRARACRERAFHRMAPMRQKLRDRSILGMHRIVRGAGTPLAGSCVARVRTFGLSRSVSHMPM
jgi:hypothetical protein